MLTYVCGLLELIGDASIDLNRHHLVGNVLPHKHISYFFVVTYVLLESCERHETIAVQCAKYVWAAYCDRGVCQQILLIFR